MFARHVVRAKSMPGQENQNGRTGKPLYAKGPGRSKELVFIVLGKSLPANRKIYTFRVGATGVPLPGLNSCERHRILYVYRNLYMKYGGETQWVNLLMGGP